MWCHTKVIFTQKLYDADDFNFDTVLSSNKIKYIFFTLNKYYAETGTFENLKENNTLNDSILFEDMKFDY